MRTTVGYGDIVPNTTAGRVAGIAIMFTGIAVLGVLAGSLSSLLNLERTSEDDHSTGDAPTGPAGTQPIHAETAALQTIERRLGELARCAPSERT